MKRKGINKYSILVKGRKSSFGIGFDISKYGISFELGLWYVGIEF